MTEQQIRETTTHVLGLLTLAAFFVCAYVWGADPTLKVLGIYAIWRWVTRG